MNKAVSVMRIIAIILNASLGVFLSLAMLGGGVGGTYFYWMLLVILTAAVNILILSLGRRLITGVVGMVSICLASVLNTCSLLGVITGLAQYGLPEEPVAVIAVILWLVFPVVTLPMLFIVRSRLKHNTPVSDVIICPNCGTEIQR